jgi:hypothetical protein
MKKMQKEEIFGWVVGGFFADIIKTQTGDDTTFRGKRNPQK